MVLTCSLLRTQIVFVCEKGVEGVAVMARRKTTFLFLLRKRGWGQVLWISNGPMRVNAELIWGDIGLIVWPLRGKGWGGVDEWIGVMKGASCCSVLVLLALRSIKSIISDKILTSAISSLGLVVNRNWGFREMIEFF